MSRWITNLHIQIEDIQIYHIFKKKKITKIINKENSVYLKSFIYISFMVRIKKGQKVKQKVKCAGIWPWPFIIPLSVPVNEIDTVYL